MKTATEARSDDGLIAILVYGLNTAAGGTDGGGGGSPVPLPATGSLSSLVLLSAMMWHFLRELGAAPPGLEQSAASK
jgi:hypothetical protein